MLDDSVENERFVQMAQMESSKWSVHAIRDALVTSKVKLGGGEGHFADACYFLKQFCVQEFIFFALHEPLPVNFPCLNFVLCFTYHLPHPHPPPPALF